MTRLVTLEQAKEHLRVDHTLDDADIDLKMQAASAVVLQYIGDAQYLFLDTGGDLLALDTSTSALEDVTGLRVQRTAQQATLLLLGDMYRHRGAHEITSAPGTDLPIAVAALLRPYRTPTLA